MASRWTLSSATVDNRSSRSGVGWDASKGATVAVTHREKPQIGEKDGAVQAWGWLVRFSYGRGPQVFQGFQVWRAGVGSGAAHRIAETHDGWRRNRRRRPLGGPVAPGLASVRWSGRGRAPCSRYERPNPRHLGHSR